MKKTYPIWIPEKEIKLDKRIKPEYLKSIVFTKIGGYHEKNDYNESLWHILQRKKIEDDNKKLCRGFWWGYDSKNKLHPEDVQIFAKNSKTTVLLVMTKTYKQVRNELDGELCEPCEMKEDKEGYRGNGWADTYSIKDGEKKDPIPSKMIGVPYDGIALIAKNLRRVNFFIDLCSYKKFKTKKYLCSDELNKKQRDTHLATLVKNRKCRVHSTPLRKQIYFVAELCHPYCVYTYENEKD